MKKSKHGHRIPDGKGKSMRGPQHKAYDSIYGDQGKKHPARKDGDRHSRAVEKRLSKERL